MNMNDKNRNDIFQTFWSLDSNDRKKNCIIANTTEKKTRTYLDESFFQTFVFHISGVALRFLNSDFFGSVMKFGAFLGGVPFGLPLFFFSLTGVLGVCSALSPHTMFSFKC
jgi:hypothetical protein